MEQFMSLDKRVVSVIRDQLGVPEERITPDLNILGEFDSPDHVELIMVLEEEFDITIPDKDAVKITTVAQAIHYIEEHAGRSKVHRSEGTLPASLSEPLWDRELDG